MTDHSVAAADPFLPAQRGRALLDFEVTARKTATALHMAAERELAAAGITADTLPDDMTERHRVIDAALDASPVFRARKLLGDWCARQHGVAAEQAFEEIADRAAPALARLDEGPTTIDYRPGFVAPDYWARVWFHRTAGGWDAGPNNGFVHGEFVHKRYVFKIFGERSYVERREILRAVPQQDYRRILDIGASSGHFTLALADVYPDAQIVGIDPSPRMLEQARRQANQRGLAWQLHVGVGEDSGFDDGSFDLVTVYAVHHELPPKVIGRLFAEAYRLLRPGGDLLISDVPRSYEQDRLAAWRQDWNARWGGEPYWRASAAMDFRAMAQEAGFTETRGFMHEPHRTAYVCWGRKPS